MDSGKSANSFPYSLALRSCIEPSPDREIINPNAHGRAVTVICGISIDFELEIDAETGMLDRASFRTNGCGFVVAAANIFSEKLKGKRLIDLRALGFLENEFRAQIGEVELNRTHCVQLCVEAIQTALSDYRLKLLEEWTGTGTLICTCFGVSEKTIMDLISDSDIRSVEEIGDMCNAGLGCGSCQPLIQEMLDAE